MAKRRYRGLHGASEDSFAQELTQVVENYKSRGRTCKAAKDGLDEAAHAHQRIVTSAGGEYVGSRYDRQASDLIERFKRDIDRTCGCTAKTSRFAAR